MQRDLQNTLIELLEPCKVGHRSYHALFSNSACLHVVPLLPCLACCCGVVPSGCCVTYLCPALQFHNEKLNVALKNLRRANFISSLKRTAVLQLADAQVDHHMDANPDLLGMENCVVDLVSALAMQK